MGVDAWAFDAMFWELNLASAWRWELPSYASKLETVSEQPSLHPQHKKSENESVDHVNKIAYHQVERNVIVTDSITKIIVIAPISITTLNHSLPSLKDKLERTDQQHKAHDACCIGKHLGPTRKIVAMQNLSHGAKDFIFRFPQLCLLYTSPSPRDA